MFCSISQKSISLLNVNWFFFQVEAPDENRKSHRKSSLVSFIPGRQRELNRPHRITTRRSNSVVETVLVIFKGKIHVLCYECFLTIFFKSIFCSKTFQKVKKTSWICLNGVFGKHFLTHLVPRKRSCFGVNLLLWLSDF